MWDQVPRTLILLLLAGKKSVVSKFQELIHQLLHIFAHSTSNSTGVIVGITNTHAKICIRDGGIDAKRTFLSTVFISEAPLVIVSLDFPDRKHARESRLHTRESRGYRNHLNIAKVLHGLIIHLESRSSCFFSRTIVYQKRGESEAFTLLRLPARAGSQASLDESPMWKGICSVHSCQEALLHWQNGAAAE